MPWILKFAGDEKGSWLASLTPRERWWLDKNPGKVLDMGQSGRPIVGSPFEDLFTLVSGMGLIWQCVWARPYCPAEISASQGEST